MTGAELKALIPDTATVWLAINDDDAYEMAAEDFEVDADGDLMILVASDEADEGDEADEEEFEEDDSE